MGFIFSISFRSNLSISSIYAITGFKSSSSISLLTLTSLYFNYLSFNFIKYFSNSKNYSLPLKSFSFPHCLSIFSQYFCFHNLNFPFLYIKENFGKNFGKQKYYIQNKSSDFLKDFKRFTKYSYKIHNSYISYNLPADSHHLHNLYNLHNSYNLHNTYNLHKSYNLHNSYTLRNSYDKVNF